MKYLLITAILLGSTVVKSQIAIAHQEVGPYIIVGTAVFVVIQNTIQHKRTTCKSSKRSKYHKSKLRGRKQTIRRNRKRRL